MTQEINIFLGRSPLAHTYEDKGFIYQIVRLSWLVLASSILYQVIFFWSLINVMAITSVVVTWLITAHVFLNQSLLEKFPLSGLLIIGFATTQLYFPLLFTTLEGKPLIYNLEEPELVFLHSTASFLVLLISHAFYRLLSKLSDRSFSVMQRAGYFTPPTELQLWLMGLIGIGAAYYVYFLTPDIGREVTGEASGKLLQGLLPFQYAPFFIPLGKLFGGEDVKLRRVAPLLFVYSILLFAISIGRNSTGALMFGFTAVAFGYLLGLVLGIYHAKILSLKNVVIVIAFGWLLIGPLADLRTAMVLVRDQRTEVSAAELISMTLDAFYDTEAIESRREYDATTEGEWDERYLDNVFTARFGNIKFNDINLVQALKVREHDPDMLKYSADYLLGGLPDPVLKALKIDVDKASVYSVSIGDYLYLAAGGYGTVSGFRTGHFAGTGMATFGWWYLLILGIGMIFIFYLFDKFFLVRYVPDDSPGHMLQRKLQFSFCGLLALTSVFLFFTALQSVIQIGMFMYRGWIQLVLLYFVMFHATRFLTLFSRTSSRTSEHHTS
jgi:hypothetical protein